MNLLMKLKSMVGLKPEDNLEIIYLNTPLKELNNNEVLNEKEEGIIKQLPSAKGQGLEYIKSADKETGIPYAHDGEGNIIYAKDMSNINYTNYKLNPSPSNSKYNLNGSYYKLYVYKNNKFELYNKTLYTLEEALQIDLINGMNPISSEPKYNRETGTTIMPIKLYKKKNLKSDFIIGYEPREIRTYSSKRAMLSVYEGVDVQLVHTHPADLSLSGNPQGSLSTEFFSKGDIELARKFMLPISVGTPGNVEKKLSPSIYIYYPDTKEVHYLGKPKIFSDEYDSQKFEVENIKKQVWDQTTKKFIDEDYKVIKMK